MEPDRNELCLLSLRWETDAISRHTQWHVLSTGDHFTQRALIIIICFEKREVIWFKYFPTPGNNKQVVK